MSRYFSHSLVADLGAALRHPVGILKDTVALGEFRRRLRRIAAGLQPGSGIGALHFACGMADEPERFPFFGLLAVASAQAHHPGAATFLYCSHEPTGPYWEIVRQQVTVVRAPRLNWFGVASVSHAVLRSDVVRLLALREIGGLYLEMDTLTLSNMDHIAQHDFVLGVQATTVRVSGGLCNAIMAARRGSVFAHRWLSAYHTLRSSGDDMHRDFYALKLPAFLYAQDPSDVRILRHDAWFFPGPEGVYRVLFSEDEADAMRGCVEGQLAVYLWRHVIAEVLDQWTPEQLRSGCCLYAELARSALDALVPAQREWLTAQLGLGTALAGSVAPAVASGATL